MKNLLLVLLGMLAFNFFASAQPCPYGTINESVWGSPSSTDFGFTLDSVLNDVDTAYITQGEDTTIYMQYLLPKEQNISQPISGTATVTSVQVLGVAGLPIGISFTVDSVAAANNNTYFPQDYRYGVVTLCGETFASPGLKTLTVTVNGCGSLSGISQCQAQSFPLYIRVLPGSSSGVIAMTPPNGCEEQNVDFEKQISDPNPNLFTTEYSWDFAGLDSANGASANFFFNVPGTYPITLTQTVYEYYISEISVTLTGGWYPDIEELTNAQSPEPYMRVNAGGASDLVGQSSGNPSGRSRTWTGLGIAISDTAISFNAFDEDTRTPIVGSQDDDLGTTIETIIPTSTNPGTSYGFSSGNFTGTYKVGKRILQTSEFPDTVVIYDLSTTVVQTPNGTEFCPGDSIVLDAGAGFDFYQWFRDSTQIFGADTQVIKVSTPGNYYVEVLEPGNICTGFSDTVSVTSEPVPTPVIQASGDGSFLYVNNPDSFQVQWYLDSVAIPGEEGDTLETLGSAGPFTVEFTNGLGCSALSAPIEQCVGGMADMLSMDTLACGCDSTVYSEAYNITSSGFSLKLGTDLAWAVNPVSEGFLDTEAEMDSAAARELVFLSNSDGSFDLEACNFPDLTSGNYYLTPFAVEAVTTDTVFWNPQVDSNYCAASLEICIGLSGSDWKIDPLTIELPNGDVIDVIEALAGGIVAPGTPITPSLWNLATASLGDPACLDLIDIIGYYDNPNGIWKINIPNNGTGDLNFNIDAFNIVVDADSCPEISQDQVIPMPGISATVAAGETRTFNIVVPPLPSGFPALVNSCQAFGDPIEFSYKEPCTTVGVVEEYNILSSMSVYPNPNDGRFVVEFDLMQPEQINLSLYNSVGEKVANSSWNGMSGNYRKTFDMNTLSAGVYLIQLTTETEQLTKKVIIQ